MDAAAQERYRRFEEGDRQGDEYDTLCLALSKLLGIGTAANEEEGVDALFCLAEQSNEYSYGETIFIEPRMLAVQLCIILEDILNTRLFPIEPLCIITQGPDEEEYEKEAEEEEKKAAEDPPSLRSDEQAIKFSNKTVDNPS